MTNQQQSHQNNDNKTLENQLTKKYKHMHCLKLTHVNYYFNVHISTWKKDALMCKKANNN